MTRRQRWHTNQASLWLLVDTRKPSSAPPRRATGSVAPPRSRTPRRPCLGGIRQYGCAVNTSSMDALSLSPSVDGTAASSNAPSTLVVAAPPSVPMAPIDAAARAVANSSQTPTGDASQSTGKRKAMEQQTELSTTCPVCKHTAGHNGGSIVTAPCCEKQLYCRACVTDLITKGCKSCLGCTNKLQPLRDFKLFRVSEIESPAVRALVQDLFDLSRRCDMTPAPTPAAAAVVPDQTQIVAALMHKLKDNHFPALPDDEVPTRKVIPGQQHPGTLISSPYQPRPLTPRPLTPRPLRSHRLTPTPSPTLSPSGIHMRGRYATPPPVAL